MPRRRLAVLGALVLIPLIGFLVTKFALDSGGDGQPVAADRTTTSTTAEATTTSEETTTTTTVAPSTTTSTTLPPGNPAKSPLPSIPRPGEPVPAATNDALAAQIRTAEAAIADPATPPDELRRQAHVQQVAYRTLANDQARREAVFGLLGDLRVTAETNVSANMKLRSMIKEPRTALPPWRIVPPAPPAELLGYYKQAETDLGVPWYYLASIHLVETRMGRIRGNSEANAQGPMQFLPSTWEQYGNGGDIQSNKDAIAAAARYLKRNGAPNDMRNALFNYNRDTRYVDAVLAFGDRMKADERAYYGYHGWQVYYVTTVGDVWLPEGYVAE